MTKDEIRKLKRGDILFLRHHKDDAPESVKFVRYIEDHCIAVVQHKEKFVKGGFGNTGHSCLISKLSKQ